MRFIVKASVGNSDGVFDAAYEFGSEPGEEAGLVGSAEQIGAEVTRFLSMLTPPVCEEMKYGTGQFFVELVIEPVTAGPQVGTQHRQEPSEGSAGWLV